MGVLLDAQALVALFRDEPGAGEVESVLRRGDVSMTTPNLAETLDVLTRVDGCDEQFLASLIGSLSISVIPMAEPHAWIAARLRARHYHRARSDVSLADCVLVAVAAPTDVIATADRAVLRMAEAEGVATLPLPDSRGRLPRA